ncbi:uncharacterized protein LOC125377798 [Haliotis rufescens]|uniref:uncharacterized protein LOC125377798 n=1 Tax=Haliotis rufescens TaxID=6454 RepID=UPI00201EC76B|nr:uncharacterized protein LOC125377798 [Haliotis rufescens]
MRAFAESSGVMTTVSPSCVSAILRDITGSICSFINKIQLEKCIQLDEVEKTMTPTTAVPVIRLPPGLPTVVMGDGTRCLVDHNTIWIPAGNPVNFSLGAGYPQPRLLQPEVQPSVTGIPLTPAVQPPPSSRRRETMPVSQPPVSLPSSVLEVR